MDQEEEYDFDDFDFDGYDPGDSFDENYLILQDFYQEMNIDAEVQDHNESVRINAQDVTGSVSNETQFQKLYRLQSRMMHEALNEEEELPPIETNNER